MYYTTTHKDQAHTRTVAIPGIQAVDLHTGEKLWYLNDTSLSFGQTLFFASYNVNGAFNYLWSVTGSNYTAYSPDDGSFQYMYYNVPSGTRVFGPSGEILIYQINYATAGWHFGTQHLQDNKMTLLDNHPMAVGLSALRTEFQRCQHC